MNLAADGNNNQIVDAGDYTFWLSHFGQTAGSGSGSGADLSQSSVPEPGTATSFRLSAQQSHYARRKRNRR